jgi:hypothetical protein
MRKRTEPTIIENTLATVTGFERAYQKMQQQVALKGQSKSTLENYIRRIAIISLHFGKLPELVSDDEINEYLPPHIPVDFRPAHIPLNARPSSASRLSRPAAPSHRRYGEARLI